MSLQSIIFEKSDRTNVLVQVLDQLLLPYTSKYVPIYTIDDGYTVIKNMQVRGAPAIAMVGALSVLLETQLLTNKNFTATQFFYDVSSWAPIRTRLTERLEFLLSSRPTAVNLSNALKDISSILHNCEDLTSFNSEVFDYTCKLLDEDSTNNKKMGDNGAEYLLKSLEMENFAEDFAVLTICNTGSLATAGYGTALGVIRSLWKDSVAKTDLSQSPKKIKSGKPRLAHVYPLETRPYNQGSRLTAYELVHDEIPCTLITDSSIAYRIKTSDVPIKAAFVGADRIVRNGDTANKIGTYQLSILCKQFGIKFFVVAPKTTIDSVTETGDGIIVEERKPEEFKLVTGTLIDNNGGIMRPAMNENNEPINAQVGIAPPNAQVWNPSFDVTPHEFIDGIVTEEGVFVKNSQGNFDLQALF
ncbi:hypothetical protein KAFR_0A05430 [Kazachstania africana CBS 2517]|uniref:Methylthioribose-1-phosphate isomerase n=1 Tax=Kazachstania africana (strain ATCC 22294 / BCRC 22015 / CBS 2517 / CECT 1963 / NBRC 1671 / NRRL Y-8276) TaxID=1071382 RepID=H2ANM8_KAZAF|nr:hypothetical protein KAFR_0A05430 [Kazachstania africana CBS 2517]CCF55978.1 hypothetical protein KAFR_0A05430 [Kazachstania africana CBS 2517]